jgi:hypothetical protein
MPTKRGRAAEAEAVEAEAPKKRGRPIRATDPVVVIDAPRRGRRSLAAEDAPKKRIGRRPIVVKAAPAPKTRVALARKEEIVVEQAVAVPKKRGGRPAETVNLHRVVGSPRVAKPTSPRSKPAPAPTPRMNPLLRSKLRTRLSPAKVIEAAPQAPKRRGRPPKAVPATAPAPKKGRVGKPAPAVAAKPVKAAVTKAAVTKPPRKKRGITSLDVPDKFVAQVEQLLQQLQDIDSLPTRVEEEDEEQHEEDAEAQAGAEEDVEIAAGEDVQDDQEEEYDMIEQELQQEQEQHAFVDGAEDEADLGIDLGYDLDLGVDIDDDMEEEAVENIVIHEDHQEEPVEYVTEVQLEMSVHGSIQGKQDNDMDIYEEDLGLNRDP